MIFPLRVGLLTFNSKSAMTFSTLYKFPLYVKAELPYGTFPKPKWCKGKKQLPSDTSCWQMHRINWDEAQILTDPVYSSGDLRLRC